MSEASVFFQGASLGASLIVAIGAQNAFVLTKAVENDHALPVATLCAFIDIMLIAAGVGGLGAVIESSSLLRLAATAGGASFLFWFGWCSVRQALQEKEALLLAGEPEGKAPESLRPVLAACLGVSLLNPHVYLDTVVMLGSIGGTYGDARFWFGAGAATASVVWFYSLCFAGRLLAPLFAKPRAWTILHLVVALLVWRVAAALALELWRAAA